MCIRDRYEYEIIPLVSNTPYHFQIRGVSEVGEGVWSEDIAVKTKEGEVHDYGSQNDVYWGDDGIDNDGDGLIDYMYPYFEDPDEDKYGPPKLDDNFDYDAAGVRYNDDYEFDG